MHATQARNLQISAHSQQSLVLTRTSYYLFMAFVAYLVLPLADIPLLDLSPSAILIGLVSLEVFFRYKDDRFGQLGGWFILIYMMWLAFVVSVAGNALLGNFAPAMSDISQLIRATFWLVAFLTTMLILSRISLTQLRQVMILLGLCLITLALLRLGEAFFFDRWGAGSARLLTQNTYGILFSTFTPFAIMLAFILQGKLRWLALLGIVLVLAAIMINGSRSSWITVSTGLLIFAAFYAFAQPKRIGTLMGMIIGLTLAGGIMLSFIPSEAIALVTDRFETLENVERDKSLGVREAMIAKSEALFNRSPIIGTGTGRFTITYIEFEIPDVVSYTDLNRLNNRSSHNSYARHVAETGLLGSIPFAIFIIILTIRGAVAALQLARQNEFWAIAVFASFISMSIHQWSIDNLSNTAPWFIYGLVAATIIRASLLRQLKKVPA